MVVDVETYAKALVKNKTYRWMWRARMEARRYNKKAKMGLVEPLQCSITEIPLEKIDYSYRK